jgi:hypothetical protein
MDNLGFLRFLRELLTEVIHKRLVQPADLVDIAGALVRKYGSKIGMWLPPVPVW